MEFFKPILVGQTVEVVRHGDQVQLFHRSALIATHPLLSGKHQVHIAPEHSPGAIARNQRQRHSHAPRDGAAQRQPEVEVRDLHVYEQLAQVLESASVRHLRNQALPPRDLKAISGTLLNSQRIREKAAGTNRHATEAPLTVAEQFRRDREKKDRGLGRCRVTENPLDQTED